MQLTKQAILAFAQFAESTSDAAVQLARVLPLADLQTQRRPGLPGWAVRTQHLWVGDWVNAGDRRHLRELVVTTQRDARGRIGTVATLLRHDFPQPGRTPGRVTLDVGTPPVILRELPLTRDDPDAGKRLTERKILGLHDRAMLFLHPHLDALAAWAYAAEPVDA